MRPCTSPRAVQLRFVRAKQTRRTRFCPRFGRSMGVETRTVRLAVGHSAAAHPDQPAEVGGAGTGWRYVAAAMASSVSLGAVGDVAASHHGATTRRQAAELGLTAKAVSALIRQGVLEEPAPGLLVVRGSTASPERLLTAASLLAAPHGVVADAPAAWLHRLDGFERPPRRAVLAVPKGRRVAIGSLPIEVRTTRAGIDPRDVVAFGPIRSTGLARTICDVAATADARTVERLVDDFERRGRPLGWLEQTARRLRASGRSGPPLVLAEIEARTRRRAIGGASRVRGSWFQKLLAECLASPLIPGLVEEYEVRDEAGRFIARCDLAVPWVRLGIEAHSRQFHFGTAAEASDEYRENRLAAAGWESRHIGWTATTHTPAQTRRMVEAMVARRAADFGIPFPLPD